MFFIAKSMTTICGCCLQPNNEKSLQIFRTICKIRGSRSSVAEDPCLLGCDAPSLGASFLHNVRRNSKIDPVAHIRILESFCHHLGESVPSDSFLNCSVDTAPGRKLVHRTRIQCDNVFFRKPACHRCCTYLTTWPTFHTKYKTSPCSLFTT